MRGQKSIAAILATGFLLSGCSIPGSFGDRSFPNAPTVYKTVDGKVTIDDNGTAHDKSDDTPMENNVEELGQAVVALQNRYQELTEIYSADSDNFSLYYLVTATASAAAAVFGAHPDALKGAALAAGVGVGAETIASPQQKRDALYSSSKKLGCVYTASIPLLSAINDDKSKATIVAATRQIHFNLLEEFKGERLDHSKQIKALVDAANAAETQVINAHIELNAARKAGAALTDPKNELAEAERQKARAAVLACVI